VRVPEPFSLSPLLLLLCKIKGNEKNFSYKKYCRTADDDGKAKRLDWIMRMSFTEKDTKK
jgi:hypothetical protein